MSDSDSRALDLITLREIRGSAEGRRLLDLALGTDDAAREARERLDVSGAVVELWREFRQSTSDREGRAVSGYERLGAWAAGGDPGALVELLSLARFLVEHRVPQRGNLDAAMFRAVAVALDRAIEHFRPRPARRPGRRPLAESRAVAQRVRDLVRCGRALVDRSAPAATMTETEAVKMLAELRGCSESTIWNHLADARKASGTRRP